MSAETLTNFGSVFRGHATCEYIYGYNIGLRDNYWGNGGLYGNGLNRLGKLLELIRKKIKEKSLN